MTLEGKSKCSCHVERICPTWLSIFAMTLNCNRGVNVVHYPLAARVFCSQLLQRHDSIWFSFIHLQTMLLMFGKRCCSCLWSYDDPEVPQTYVYYYFCIVLHCILAKVLRNGTNLWHVFRLFVLKLTWSPLKIAGCFFFLVGCCEQIGSGHPCISPGLGDALVVLKQICHRWNPGRHGLETSLAFWKMQSLESRLKFLRTSLQPLFLVKEVQECSNGPDVWCVFKCDSDNCDMKWFEYSSCGIVCIRLHCFFTKFCLHKSPSGPCRVTNR